MRTVRTLLITFILTILGTVAVQAEPYTGEIPLYLGDQQVYCQNGAWQWQNATYEGDNINGTLSLNGFNYKGSGHNNSVIYNGVKHLTIDLKGENKIELLEDKNNVEYPTVISVPSTLVLSDSDITITSSDNTGSLEIICNAAEFHNGAYGIHSVGTVNIKNAEVSIATGCNKKGGYNFGICADNVNFTNSDIFIQCGDTNDYNHCIDADNEIKISGGTLYVDSGKADSESAGSYGICGGLTIDDNAKVVAAAGWAKETSCAVQSGLDKPITIKSGEVLFVGGEAEYGGSYGVYSFTNSRGIEIGKDVKTVIISGQKQAVYGLVRTNINGTGYNDIHLEKEGGEIPITTTGDKYDYKGMVFPAPKKITATVKGYEGIYDGNEHGIDITVSDPTDNYYIEYAETEGQYAKILPPMYKEVGTHTVYYKITAAGYKVLTGHADVIIKEKENNSQEDNNRQNNSSVSGNESVSDNKPKNVSVETVGSYQVEYAHDIPFYGKGKVTPETFGGLSVSQGNITYSVTKVKVNKKLSRIQITGLNGADKSVVKEIKRLTKGSNGLPFTVLPYYVKSTDNVAPKYKKDGSIKSLSIFINNKKYKCKKNEYEFNIGTRIIKFKGKNLTSEYKT